MLFTLTLCSNLYAKSCEKNGTCKGRFEIQNDPYDIRRESSRAHISTFFLASFALNRALENPSVQQTLGLKLTKSQRIWYTFIALNLAGLAKEFAYDPDGLSRSDTLSNGLGLVLELPVEFEFF